MMCDQCGAASEGSWQVHGSDPWGGLRFSDSLRLPPGGKGGVTVDEELLIAVEELGAVHDRYDSLRSDNAGSGGDDPWPGGDGNLHESE